MLGGDLFNFFAGFCFIRGQTQQVPHLIEGQPEITAAGE